MKDKKEDLFIFKIVNTKIKISDSDFIDDLQNVCKMLGTNTIPVSQYCKKNGAKYSYAAATQRFGGWVEFCKKAGVVAISAHGGNYGDNKISDKLLIEDMQRVSKLLNEKNITQSQYNSKGIYCAATLSMRLGGSWNKAKERAGLEAGAYINPNEIELLDNLKRIWLILGRQPKMKEVTRPFSDFNYGTYYNKFGSWALTLSAFVAYIQNEEISTKAQSNLSRVDSTHLQIKKTSRTINIRTRYKVLKRDGYKCIFCGSSPSKDESVKLHIDHIVPWSKGGETVIDNLQTLCSTCNLGKSNSL